MTRVSLKIKPEGRARGDEPSPVDIYVGNRLRQLRSLAGLSQDKLGEALGLTFQQVQKYERGQNRIAASRLFDVSRILNVAVSYFFEGYESPTYREPADSKAMQFADSEQQAGYEAPGRNDIMSRKETLDMIRAYYQIPDSDVRKRVLELVRSMAPQPASTAKMEKEKPVEKKPAQKAVAKPKAKAAPVKKAARTK